jgi:hypothetical protein
MLIDLTRKSSSGKQRSFEFAVVPQVKDHPIGKPWIVRGTVMAAIIVKSPIIDLGEVIRLGSGCESKVVPFSLEVPGTEVKATCSTNLVSVEISGSDREQYCLKITPSMPANLGPFEAPIALGVHSRDGSLLSTSKLWVKGIISDEIQFMPTQFLFGVRQIGSTLSERAVLCSLLKRPFSILHIRCPETMKLAGPNPARDTRFTFDLSMEIVGERDHEETAFVSCKDSDENERVVPLTVKYFAVK